MNISEKRDRKKRDKMNTNEKRHLEEEQNKEDCAYYQGELKKQKKNVSSPPSATSSASVSIIPSKKRRRRVLNFVNRTGGGGDAKGSSGGPMHMQIQAYEEVAIDYNGFGCAINDMYGHISSCSNEYIIDDNSNFDKNVSSCNLKKLYDGVKRPDGGLTLTGMNDDFATVASAISSGRMPIEWHDTKDELKDGVDLHLKFENLYVEDEQPPMPLIQEKCSSSSYIYDYGGNKNYNQYCGDYNVSDRNGRTSWNSFKTPFLYRSLVSATYEDSDEEDDNCIEGTGKGSNKPSLNSLESWTISDDDMNKYASHMDDQGNYWPGGTDANLQEYEDVDDWVNKNDRQTNYASRQYSTQPVKRKRKLYKGGPYKTPPSRSIYDSDHPRLTFISGELGHGDINGQTATQEKVVETIKTLKPGTKVGIITARKNAVDIYEKLLLTGAGHNTLSEHGVWNARHKLYHEDERGSVSKSSKPTYTEQFATVGKNDRVKVFNYNYFENFTIQINTERAMHSENEIARRRGKTGPEADKGFRNPVVLSKNHINVFIMCIKSIAKKKLSNMYTQEFFRKHQLNLDVLVIDDASSCLQALNHTLQTPVFAEAQSLSQDWFQYEGAMQNTFSALVPGEGYKERCRLREKFNKNKAKRLERMVKANKESVNELVKFSQLMDEFTSLCTMVAGGQVNDREAKSYGTVNLGTRRIVVLDGVMPESIISGMIACVGKTTENHVKVKVDFIRYDPIMSRQAWEKIVLYAALPPTQREIARKSAINRVLYNYQPEGILNKSGTTDEWMCKLKAAVNGIDYTKDENVRRGGSVTHGSTAVFVNNLSTARSIIGMLATHRYSTRQFVNEKENPDYARFLENPIRVKVCHRSINNSVTNMIQAAGTIKVVVPVSGGNLKDTRLIAAVPTEKVENCDLLISVLVNIPECNIMPWARFGHTFKHIFAICPTPNMRGDTDRCDMYHMVQALGRICQPGVPTLHILLDYNMPCDIGLHKNAFKVFFEWEQFKQKFNADLLVETGTHTIDPSPSTIYHGKDIRHIYDVSESLYDLTVERQAELVKKYEEIQSQHIAMLQKVRKNLNKTHDILIDECFDGYNCDSGEEAEEGEMDIGSNTGDMEKINEMLGVLAEQAVEMNKDDTGRIKRDVDEVTLQFLKEDSDLTEEELAIQIKEALTLHKDKELCNEGKAYVARSLYDNKRMDQARGYMLRVDWNERRKKLIKNPGVSTKDNCFPITIYPTVTKQVEKIDPLAANYRAPMNRINVQMGTGVCDPKEVLVKILKAVYPDCNIVDYGK